MSQRARLVVCAIALLVLVAPRVNADPIISPGLPTTTVPTYLTDGSYPFPTSVSPLDPDEFLLPVIITGAVNLQFWQFTLLFDNTVVEHVDTGDGSSGIYGAEFTSGDPSSLSFILSGFPLNPSGLIDTVGGSYPSLLTGPSGDGDLALIVFRFIEGQETNDPDFRVQDPSVVQGVPEPATLVLLLSALVLLFGRIAGREQRSCR